MSTIKSKTNWSPLEVPRNPFTRDVGRSRIIYIAFNFTFQMGMPSRRKVTDTIARMSDNEVLAAYDHPPPRCSTAACTVSPVPLCTKGREGKRKVGVLKGRYHMRRRKDDVQQRVSLSSHSDHFWGLDRS
jgi:hypothetical protein